MRAWLPWVMLLAGCSSSGGPAPGTNICHPPACTFEESTLYAAEVSPAANTADRSGGAALPQEWSTVNIDPDSGEFVLQLVLPVILSGTVTVGGLPASATVVASRPSSIPGRPDVIYQAETDPSTGQYRLQVTPTQGTEQYAVRVLAASPSKAPPRQLQLAIPEDHHLDVDLDDPQTAVEILGAVRTPLQIGVVGMTVEVVDTSGTILSTVDTTDKNGQYSVLVDHHVDLSMAKVTASPGGNSPAGTPTLASAIVGQHWPAGSAQVIDLPLPALPAPIHLIYRVSGVGSSGAKSPIVGASCLFHIDVSDPNSTVSAIYEAEAVSQAEGAAEVDLLPGDRENRVYGVRISPPPASEFEAVSTTASVGSASGYAAPFVLPLRPQVSGRTLDVLGRPVADVAVEPSLPTLEIMNGVTPLSTLAKISVTESDEDGRFVFRVDRGTYDMSLLPSSSTHLSRHWLSAVTVSSDTDLGDLQLLNGVVARAHVIGPTGAPLPSASVRLYMLPPANLLCLSREVSCLSPAWLQSEGTSDGNGDAALLLAGRSAP